MNREEVLQILSSHEDELKKLGVISSYLVQLLEMRLIMIVMM